MQNIARTNLKKQLTTPEIMVCASVYDPLSARMAQEIGFKLGILGGSVASLIALGAPDINLLTLTELAAHAKRVCQASDLPVIVDGDNGYGNALNVMRTIEELEYAGASLVTIEDTILPCRYKEPALSQISLEEAKLKLEAAVSARKDKNLSIFARTHALNEGDNADMLQRIKAYSKTGIDGICIFGVTDNKTLRQISDVTHLPIMLISYGNPDLGEAEELIKLGVRIRLSGHKSYEESVKASYLSLLKLHQGDNYKDEEVDAKALIKRLSDSEQKTKLTQQYIYPN
ncbi:MAG: isocitrate lyase/PEP mutase family protein [Marinomonas sp.]